ncbi:MAG: aspartate aminotransferase family protein, partial [Patescibacteria group bacterium]
MKSKYSFLTKNVIPTTNIHVKKAKGIFLWDTNNKKYLDFSSQTLNLSLGNSPEIAKNAFLKQFKDYTYLSTRFINHRFMELSKK